MAVLQDSKEIFVDETERKPNMYAANVLAGVVAVIAIVCFMNEIGVFQVSALVMRICLLVSLSQFVILQFITEKPAWIIHPASKYVIIVMILFLVLTVTVLLNIHAILAFVLPILLAIQYRSRKVSCIALIGSCVCCAAAPVLSYLLNTWSLNFLSGYIETFCKVTINATPTDNAEFTDALWKITLYWSLPQMLTLGAFGVILFSATNNGIESVTNQIQVLDLSNDLHKQLESVMSMQEKVLYSMSDIIEWTISTPKRSSSG